MADLFHFLSTYGYLAVFIGSFFEGETVVLLAGALSHEGYLYLPFVIILGFLGAAAGDSAWFFLGRYQGERVLTRWKWFQKVMDTPVSVVNKNPIRLAFLMRFMYGFRHVVPFSLGMSTIQTKTFLIWNQLGALCWSVVFVGAGFMFINIVEELVGNLRRYEFKIIILAVVVVVIISTVGRLIKKAVRNEVEQLP